MSASMLFWCVSSHIKEAIFPSQWSGESTMGLSGTLIASPEIETDNPPQLRTQRGGYTRS